MEHKKYIIDLLSDTHNRHGEFKCEGGDILIHSGDVSKRGTAEEILQFILWFEIQPYKHKIFIPGNHDFDLERNFPYWQSECQKRGIVLLNDSGIIIKDMFDPTINIKIWGSPVQPWFHSWAFNRHIDERHATAKHPWIKPHWDMIHEGTEILLTHGPAHTILDKVVRGNLNVGCPHLAKRIEELGIGLHVCGHIHEGRGFHYAPKTTYVNASSLDHMYWPSSNKPMRVIREICQDGSIAYVL